MTATDYEALFRIAKVLLADDDQSRTPELLLRNVIEMTGAERGFILVREGETFVQKFDVQFDPEGINENERNFSRTLVRLAIQRREVIYSRNFAVDARFAGTESLAGMRPNSVLVTPLAAHDQVYGAIYLVGELTEAHRAPLAELAEIGGRVIQRALEREELRRRNHELERDLFAQHDFAGIVTRDERMMELLKMVGQVADTPATVLVHGETGTGKELIARALHVNSARRAKPYTALHCTALPATVIESELFGHERGAFTGADRRRDGRIAATNGGTVFLDEIAEIPLDAQAKLLRFLQFGEIQRLGSDHSEKVDVRIIAATHRSLAEMVKEGKFRQDLYFRLKVIELEIPPLRERRGDVLLLIQHFLAERARQSGKTARFTPAAERVLMAYGYPGNVRELAHIVERASLLAKGEELDTDLLPADVRGEAAPAAPRLGTLTNEGLQAARDGAIREVEQTFLKALLAKSGGNVTRAAEAAGMQRTYLQRLIARYRE